jgi:DNA-binding NtrC family response regulator
VNGQAPAGYFRWTTTSSGSDPLTFTLGRGRHGVGADPANVVHLPERGVSRFHAVLYCEDGQCEVEDLDSKNGSRINGQRVQRQRVQAGDELAFASVRGRLEWVAEGDGELALELTAGGVKTTWLGAGSSSDGHENLQLALFRCLRAIDENLRLGAEPSLAAALEALTRHLGLNGAALWEFPRHGAATWLATVGRAPVLPDPVELSRALPVDGDPGILYSRLADGSLAVMRREEGGRLLVLATTGVTTAILSPALLAICLLPFSAPAEPTAEVSHPRDEKALQLPPEIVGGGSAAMVEVYRQVAMVAASPVPVLILGETGVGKEHLARALHEHSDRAGHPFVAVNCAAIPAELLEAEMFGIGHGVATGVKGRKGRFLEADHGTLFLDEIGDMPLPLQAKLLRVLQEGEVTPLGERPVKVDVRVVAASHADFGLAIAQRGFREDLFYRLAGYVLNVPPLRERLDDLPVLLGRFLQTMAREAGRSVRGVTVKAIEELRRERWPGNIRQLQQVARRLVFLCPRGQPIDSRLVAEALAAMPTAAPATAAEKPEFQLGSESLEDHLAGLEKKILLRALERTEGNRTRAASLLRLSRNALSRRLERLGIERPPDESAGADED